MSDRESIAATPDPVSPGTERERPYVSAHRAMALTATQSTGSIEPGKLALIIAVLSLGAAALHTVVARANAGPIAVQGVSLGMSPDDVRSRFRAPSAGRWRTEPLADPVLVWSADAARNEPRSVGAEADAARFEFHGGILVAARVVVSAIDPDAHGPLIDVSTASVLARRAITSGRVELTLLARDCPTHAAEVRRLLDRR